MKKMLDGKVILVTGGGGGIGSAACAVLAEHGARLVVSDINQTAGEAVAKSLCKAGGEAIYLEADLESEAAIEQLVAETLAHYGRLDGAFNNAGVEQSNIPLTELSLEQWERALRIDLTAVFLCIKHQAPAMLRSGGGCDCQHCFRPCSDRDRQCRRIRVGQTRRGGPYSRRRC